MIEEKKSEVKELIDAGYFKTPKLNPAGWLYLYNERKEHEKVDLTELDEEEQREVLEFAKTEAKKKRDELKKQKQQAGESSEKSTVGLGRKHTIEMLDKSHAQIVRNLTDATGWFADVLHEIGFYATIIAMQHAKVPPEELYEQVVRFKDPAEFSEYVKDHLAALLEATEDAQKLVELRKELDLMDAKLILLREAYQRLKNQRDELAMMVHTATASMCDDCMKRFILSWMSVKYGLSVRLGGMNDGGVVGEGVSQEEGDSRGRGEAAA